MQSDVVLLIALGGAVIYKVVDAIKFFLNSKNNAQAKNAAVTQLVVWLAGIAVIFVATWTRVAHTLTFGGSNLHNAGIILKLFVGVGLGSWASVVNDFKNAVDHTTSSATPALLGFRKSARGFVAGFTPLVPSPFDPTGGSVVPAGGSTPLFGPSGPVDPGHVVAPGGTTPLQPVFAPGNVIAPGGSVGLQGVFPAQPQRTLPQPALPTLQTATTGGTLVPATYGYRVTALNALGETLASPEATIVVPAGTSTNTVTINWVAVVGAVGYRVYGRTAGGELQLANLGNVLTWTDTGSVTPSGAMPSVNSTGGLVSGLVGAYPNPNAVSYAWSPLPAVPWSPPGGTGGSAGMYTMPEPPKRSRRR